MENFKKHLVSSDMQIKDALVLLNNLALDSILFVVDQELKLVGSLTDGDVRRGLINNKNIESRVVEFIQPNPKFIQKGRYDLNHIISLRKENFKVLPVIDSNGVVVNVINLRELKSYLPVDTVIMAGGKGTRLKPLTDSVPKPLLKVGEKPIIEHNIDRLISFGIDDIWLSVKYLGEQIETRFGDGASKGIKIEYIWENEPLGTIGAVSKVKEFRHDYVLVTNSDVLTNLNYEDFFLDFIEKGADFSVVSIPYNVDIPYAVLETKDGVIQGFKEKPTYTYFSNGGIYLMKKEMVDQIPKNQFYNATDLLQELIDKGFKVVTYPLLGYWLDVGKHEDYKRAQEDVKHINWR